jgi:hypothetical protein
VHRNISGAGFGYGKEFLAIVNSPTASSGIPLLLR